MVDDRADAEFARQREDLERRLAAGEWLGIPQVATLFGVHRRTVHRWARVHVPPLIRTKPSSPAGGTAALLCHPEDVKTLRERLQGGTA